MAIVIGDVVVSAGAFNGESEVANLAVGSLCPDGLLLGVFNGLVDAYVNWNNGTVTGVVSTQNLRKVTAYTGPDLFGKTVRLTGYGPEFIGAVVQQLDVELDATDGEGDPTPVVVVKAFNFSYVALPASVEENI
jgi:hypothetical protein